jgi:hypothetical protein
MQDIHALPLEDRNREYGEDPLRLEELQLDAGKGHLFCDFLKIRTGHGPGRAAKNKAVEEFDLKKDEGFGEDTGLFYDFRSQIAIVQYNHYGPRIAAVAEYLSLFDHANVMTFEFTPRYQEDVLERLESKEILRRFEMTVDARLLNENDFRKGMALKEAASLSEEYGSDYVSISLRVEKRTDSMRRKLVHLGQWVVDRTNNTEEALNPFKACEVAGKDDEAAPMELLDLVAQRVSDKQAVTLGSGRRYTRESRWAALERAWHKLRPTLLANGA